MARSTTFTSYINVEPAKNIGQALSRIEAQANGSFGRIARNAENLSNRVNGVRPPVGGPARPGAAGLPRGAANTAGIDRASAAAAREAARAQQELANGSNRATREITQQAGATSRATAQTTRFNQALRTSASTLNIVQGPLGGAAGRLSALSAAMTQLSGVSLGLAGAGAALFAYGQQANTYVELRSKLVPLFEAQSDVNAALLASVRISQEARTSLQPVIDLYARLTIAGRDVGLTLRETERLTELATKAAQLSGGTNVSKEAGLYQFAQGVGSGTLQGDELKSVRENTLRLATAIARGLDVPLAALKELGAEGKLTPRVIADALERDAPRIEAELARLPKTLATSTNEFRNSLTLLIGGVEEQSGFTRALAELLSLVAANLGTVTSAVGLMAAAFIGARISTFAAGMLATSRAARAARTEIIQTARATATAAQTQRAAAGANIAALRAERTALQQRLATERAAASQLRKTALETARRVTQSGNYIYNNPREIREYRTAMNAATMASTNAAATQARLATVGQQLSGQTRIITSATNDLRSAQARAAAATTSFASRLGSFIGSLNLVGIALGIGIGLLIQWSMRNTEAARATRIAGTAQEYFAQVIDESTGKIREQITALQLLGALQAQQAFDQTKEKQQRDRIAELDRITSRSYQGSILGVPLRGNGGRPGGGAGVAALESYFNENPGAARVVRGYNQRLATDPEYTPEQYNRDVERLASSRFGSERLRENLPEVERLAIEIAGLRGDLRTSAARQRFLRGVATDEDKQLLGIGPPPAQPDGPVDEAAARRAAAAARRAEAAAERAQREAERAAEEAVNRTDKRRETLGRYDETPKAADRASEDILELNRLVGQTMNGLTEITESNPLGQGIYTQAMADGDRQRIQTGLRRPIEEAIREQGRAVEIARLRGDGYEVEADALEQALQLQEQIGVVTEADYRRILSKRRELEGVNRLIAIEASLRQSQLDIDIGALRADGYDLEARALERALSLQTEIGRVTEAEYRQILNNERAQDRINDQLAQRERLTAAITGSVEETRNAFEELLVNAPKRGLSALRDFGKTIIDNILRSQARRLTERLFQGADARVRELLSGGDGTAAAMAILESQVTRAAESVEGTAQAVDILERNASTASTSAAGLATALETTSSRVDAAGNALVDALQGTANSITGTPGPVSAPSSSASFVDATREAAADALRATLEAAGPVPPVSAAPPPEPTAARVIIPEAVDPASTATAPVVDLVPLAVSVRDAATNIGDSGTALAALVQGKVEALSGLGKERTRAAFSDDRDKFDETPLTSSLKRAAEGVDAGARPLASGIKRASDAAGELSGGTEKAARRLSEAAQAIVPPAAAPPPPDVVVPAIDTAPLSNSIDNGAVAVQAGGEALATSMQDAAAALTAAATGVPAPAITGGLQPVAANARSAPDAVAQAFNAAIGRLAPSIPVSSTGRGIEDFRAPAPQVPMTWDTFARGGWYFNAQSHATASNDNASDDDGDIVVEAGTREAPAGRQEQPIPTQGRAYDTIFEGFGNALDGIFKTDGFFKKIGGSVGSAFEGAGTGMVASGFARALGIKQSSTGAALGGGIGQIVGGPIGAAIGGLIGGTLGGLVKKSKTGSATIGQSSNNSGVQVTSTGGNNAGFRENAEGLAGTVINQLGDVADQLFADLSGDISLSIGQRNKKFTVDPTGRGRTKGKGVLKFDSEQEAVEAALRDAIADGAIAGISAASQRILQSGKDLQRALEKAFLIESIPRRLLQRENPVRFAVEELNREFVKIIQALNEGSGTAEQYADAQRLYEYERADAISEALKQSSSAIQAFLDEMTNGSSSPLNKRTVYENAGSKLDTFRADILSGKTVDQEDLLTAARDFQEASRELNGSSQAFFTDFNDLFALLSKARDNTGVNTNVVDLPASPFANDPTVQNALTSLNSATTAQTEILGAHLAELVYLFKNAAVPASAFNSGGSSIGLLPSFANNMR